MISRALKRRRRLGVLVATALMGVLIAGASATPAIAASSSGETTLAELRAGTATLEVGTDATFPPFEFTNADGSFSGFDIDLVNALALQAGIKNVEFRQIPFSNIVPALQAGQIDMGASAIYISDERAQVVDFSTSYYPGGLGVFVKAGAEGIDPNDLNGKRVAVQVGTKAVQWVEENAPQATIVQVETNAQMFTSLTLGQADAIVTGVAAAQYYAAQQGGIEQVGESVTTEKYGFAFPKNESDIRDAFNLALQQLQANGEYETLVEKYFGEAASEALASSATQAPNALDFSGIIPFLPQIGEGLLVTLQLLALSIVLSMVLGALGGLARLSRFRVLRWIGTAYVSVIRGTPLVVQLFFIYFGLPQLGIQLPALAAGVIALGLYSGSYVTEVFRGAVASIDAGQTEAARSTGMSRSKTMRLIVLPQAALRMLPPLGNEFVALAKNTALASFITIDELFLTGQTIISRTFDNIPVYLVIGAIYYLLTSAISVIMRTIEKRMAIYI